MAYSDDAVKAKLAALNETQDSIVSVAQWIMFHRRHADRTASTWLSRLHEAPNANKRLTLIYLANEVVQQSRARSKTDFLMAFEPLVADAMTVAYKGASQEVQGKIRRVVEVWRQRQIFKQPVQEAVEEKMREMDRLRGGGGKAAGGGARLGGSLFGGGSVPAQLEAVSKSQAALSKSEATAQPATTKALEEYTKMTDPSTPVPTAPMHAHKLSVLMKTLAEARGAVEAGITARKELIAGLEQLLEKSRPRLAEDEAKHADLSAKLEEIEAQKKAVEDKIMSGMADDEYDPNEPNGDSVAAHSHGQERQAPEAEGFTPPPPEVESFTPPPTDGEADGSLEPPRLGDASGNDIASTTGAEPLAPQVPHLTEPEPAFEPPPALVPSTTDAASATAFLDSLIIPSATRSASGEQLSGDSKRRKTSHKSEKDVDDDIFNQGAVGGVDEDAVAAMLGE